MISDEVEILRERGMTDKDIAATIRRNGSIEISAAKIAQNYATPEDWRQQRSLSLLW
jgi:hypothetical protein